MDFGIAGKRVLVTGASQGIGELIARAFAGEECRVAVIARREKELKCLVEEMGGADKGHAFYAADLMQKGQPEKAVRALVSSGGEFDIVVHNIGGTMNVKDPLAGVEDWNKVWQFNAGIAIEINGVVVPSMKERRWGRIIHVSSISAVSLRGSAAYCAAKAYLSAYSTVLGRALAPDGIVVSALLPGAVYAEGGHWDEKSPHNQKDPKEFLRKRADFLRHHHAIGRLGTAEEIAPFAVFMASQQVSFAATSSVPIDGGTM